MTSLETRPRPHIRPEIAALEESGIVEVWQMGFSVPDVIGLWVGEGDLPTPRFICDAATAALAAGETFYTYKTGIPELRRALAAYLEGLHGCALDETRIVVTSSGMNAMMLVSETIAGPGDNVVVVSPVWPNFAATLRILGAEPRPVALQGTPAGFDLDLDRLKARCDRRTRAVYLASPGNPTGWIMPPEQQQALLAFCRERGLWLIADEVYERFVYDGRRAAPSFLAIAEPEDPLIVVNSFSKAWAMTGWRIGWMVLPAALEPVISKLIEYNTSGGQAFLQRGALAAVRDGEPFVAEMVERCRIGRDLVLQRLGGMGRVRVVRPEGAFYVMFAVDGVSDMLAFAKRLVVEARVGLAPGSAFGPGGEDYLRLCFASSAARLSEAMDRLETLLA
ncbi:MAG: pyridoxal phosphate-dependent aminotransferase [Rhodospirillaceae bacterium]|nr:pyridoxal phosphate-dependent aminotransferase [Rhodospirillaceae bacterium]